MMSSNRLEVFDSNDLQKNGVEFTGTSGTTGTYDTYIHCIKCVILSYANANIPCGEQFYRKQNKQKTVCGINLNIIL